MDPMNTRAIEQLEQRCARRIAEIGDINNYAARGVSTMAQESPQEIAHKQKLRVWELGTLLRDARRGPLSSDKAERFAELVSELPEPEVPVEEAVDNEPVESEVYETPSRATEEKPTSLSERFWPATPASIGETDTETNTNDDE